MPLTNKGRKIMRSMRKTYGDNAERVFYASRNKGRIKGVDKRKSTRSKRRSRRA